MKYIYVKLFLGSKKILFLISFTMYNNRYIAIDRIGFDDRDRKISVCISGKYSPTSIIRGTSAY